MSDRKRAQSDRVPTILDLLDRGLSGVGISCKQLGQVTSQYQDDHGPHFELHPLQVPWRM
jgi:hypothetical protein